MKLNRNETCMIQVQYEPKRNKTCMIPVQYDPKP